MRKLLAAIAESRVTRWLTQAECDRYDIHPCRTMGPES